MAKALSFDLRSRVLPATEYQSRGGMAHRRAWTRPVIPRLRHGNERRRIRRTRFIRIIALLPQGSDLDFFGWAAEERSSALSNVTKAPIARLMPERPLPLYAYLPGRFPHPVRDPKGHSFRAQVPCSTDDATDPDAFRWGVELFNHGYYWEAHEAWEDLWRIKAKGAPERDFLHGLILLAAAGVKLREGKWRAAPRHGSRAATCLRLPDDAVSRELGTALGWSPSDLAALVEEAVSLPAESRDGQIVFGFALGSAAKRKA